MIWDDVGRFRTTLNDFDYFLYIRAFRDFRVLDDV